MRKKRLISAIWGTGAIMASVGAALYITDWWLSPYIYMVGAAFVFFAQIISFPSEVGVTIRRLYRIQLLGAFFLVLAGLAMLLLHGNDWIVLLTIAAVLELYTSFRIPHEVSKS